MLLHESYRHDKLLYNVFNSIFLFCLSLGLVGIYLFYRADVMRVRVTSNEATGWIKTEMQEVNRSLFFLQPSPPGRWRLRLLFISSSVRSRSLLYCRIVFESLYLGFIQIGFIFSGFFSAGAARKLNNGYPLAHNTSVSYIRIIQNVSLAFYAENTIKLILKFKTFFLEHSVCLCSAE